MKLETKTGNTTDGVIVKVRSDEVDVTIYCKVKPDDYTINTIARTIKNKLQ